MPFAIQLFLDTTSDMAVQSVWEELASTGVASYMRDSGNRPHFSLAIYSELNVPVSVSLLKSFAETLSPFALPIASLGVFPSEQAVVFLAPIVSPSFLDLHMQVHQLLQDAGASPALKYLPGNCTPHCTLAMRVPPQLISQAVEICLGMPFPMRVYVEEIGVIEYPPVKHLFSFRLTGG